MEKLGVKPPQLKFDPVKIAIKKKEQLSPSQEPQECLDQLLLAKTKMLTKSLPESASQKISTTHKVKRLVQCRQIILTKRMQKTHLEKQEIHEVRMKSKIFLRHTLLPEISSLLMLMVKQLSKLTPKGIIRV